MLVVYKNVTVAAAGGKAGKNNLIEFDLSDADGILDDTSSFIPDSVSESNKT